MNQEQWSEVWKGHLDSYLKVVPRTGIFCRSEVPGMTSSLEVACGSGRDSLYLYENGVDAIATDFAEGLVSELKKKFPPEMRVQREDAFDLSLDDNAVDLVFSNGFLVLFDDDTEIKRLVVERARVASSCMIFIEHNGENIRLKRKFKELGVSDPIYRIRFFSPNDLRRLVVGALAEAGVNYRSVRLKKFGGVWDWLYRAIEWRGVDRIVAPILTKMVPRLYQFQGWGRTERVAIVVKF